ncbi:hypothetical protein [Rhodoferax sp. OV413]|uniref:hypothetical protein n=1 Tax=Rhodoferax sp. OV413 TaxID=1855285 RepID=UPI002600FAE3|nr:hypothetical protein [Rhodoferax sp. OV413]
MALIAALEDFQDFQAGPGGLEAGAFEIVDIAHLHFPRWGIHGANKGQPLQ